MMEDDITWVDHVGRAYRDAYQQGADDGGSTSSFGAEGR
jgi:hypothetical protein